LEKFPEANALFRMEEAVNAPNPRVIDFLRKSLREFMMLSFNKYEMLKKNCIYLKQS
jgi:hypothetical protein